VVTAIQAVWIVGEVSLAAILSYVVVLDWLPRAMLAIGLVPFLLIAPVLLAAAVAAYAVAALAVVIVTKRLLIGRYAPVEAPVWGALHIRHWIVQQTARLVPWALIAGGEFQSMALRALGARIGRRVHIHRGVDLTQGGWDLLQIGDDVTIGQDAELRLVEFDAGRLVVGPIVMGAGVTLETRAGVDAHARLEAGSYLTAHSSLPPGHTIPAGERWDGIPARPAGPAPETPVPTRRGRAITPLQYSAALVFANVALAAIIGLPVTLAALALAALDGSDAPAVASWIASPRWHLFSLAMIGALAIAAGPITLVWEALIVRAMGRVTPEVISRWSLDYLRV